MSKDSSESYRAKQWPMLNCCIALLTLELYEWPYIFRGQAPPNAFQKGMALVLFCTPT